MHFPILWCFRVLESQRCHQRHAFFKHLLTHLIWLQVIFSLSSKVSSMRWQLCECWACLGAVCSPSYASYILRKTADYNRDSLSCQSKFLCGWLLSLSSEEAAIQRVKELLSDFCRQWLCLLRCYNRSSAGEIVDGMMPYHQTSCSNGKCCYKRSTHVIIQGWALLKPYNLGNTICSQLHHFADASKDGYGTVSYIRLKNSRGEKHVAFLLGKARVTPLKASTIPRLELTAAVLAARVDAMLKAELEVQLDESVFWTDSMSVLKYVNNEDRRFHTFVANRISAITEISSSAQWRHVGTKDNPADAASRGMKASDLLKIHSWLEWPSFLWSLSPGWFWGQEVRMLVWISLPQIHLAPLTTLWITFHVGDSWR